MAMARFCSDYSAMCCVLPVLWMTSCFHITGQTQIQATVTHHVAPGSKSAVVDCLGLCCDAVVGPRGEVDERCVGVSDWLRRQISCSGSSAGAARGPLCHSAGDQRLIGDQVTGSRWADDVCWVPGRWPAQPALPRQHVRCPGQGLHAFCVC